MMNSNIFISQYPFLKDTNLKGRYINFEAISPSLQNLEKHFPIKNEGFSILKNPIPSINIGNGPTKILAWSQMHGNETTTTKAVFDVLNFLKQKNATVEAFLQNCCVKIIPMLNPDGAKLYTRENANKTDLNRDAYNREEVESIVLRNILDEFQPNFCLNLHDQRTIFSAGGKEKPAILSFLAPSSDAERSITPPRKEAMQIISAIQADLPENIRHNIGRYDDSFNRNCTGDTFMGLQIPTILFEAGHVSGDYQREETRMYTATAILSALSNISTGAYKSYDYQDYFMIPENMQLFYDVVIRNVILEEKKVDIGIQFKEVLEGDNIKFIPVIQKISPDIQQFGHQEYDAKGEKVFPKLNNQIKEQEILKELKTETGLLSIKTP